MILIRKSSEPRLFVNDGRFMRIAIAGRLLFASSAFQGNQGEKTDCGAL